MTISINKSEHWYEAFNKALQTLEPKAFKLWSYLASKKDGWTIKFFNSEKDQARVGLSRHQLDKAWEELIRRGYIFRNLDSDQPDAYTFDDNPEEKIDIDNLTIF